VGNENETRRGDRSKKPQRSAMRNGSPFFTKTARGHSLFVGVSASVTADSDTKPFIERFVMVVEEKVKIRCPACTRVFREKTNRVRDGLQINCHNCNKLITLSKETEDPFLRRALRTAREIRAAEQDRLAAQVYKGMASAPSRETP
jgi:hypothetical protein